MTNRKVWSGGAFAEAQSFPKSLGPLQRFWGGRRKFKFSVGALIDATAHLPRRYNEGVGARVTTEDGYSWFWSPLFDTLRGKVIVAFPWCLDFDWRGGSSTDRHIAVYTTGTPTREDVREVISNLHQALVDYEKKWVREQEVKAKDAVLIDA